MRVPSVPRAMRQPPRLDPRLRPSVALRRHALLINPFYPKDPHASFGKHVLTPTLALTSIAAAPPPDWTVALVAWTRHRHVGFRERLAARETGRIAPTVTPAGV